jgi:hypothetical protein
MPHKRILRVITLLWALCIVVVTVIRGSEVGQTFKTTGFAHIATHVAVFGVLGCLLMASFHTANVRWLLWALGMTLGYATEFYEHIAFHITMEYIDVFYNTVGLTAGAAAFLLYERYRSAKNSSAARNISSR